jgi:hypothetical protein
LHTNCLLKHVIEGNRGKDRSDEKIRKKRRKQLMDYLKEMKGKDIGN